MNTFKCAVCEQEYAVCYSPEGWSDEKAKEELKENFGDHKAEECEVICDDCYYKMFPQFKREINENKS